MEADLSFVTPQRWPTRPRPRLRPAQPLRVPAQHLLHRFKRTLDASRQFVKEGTTMVLPANSDLFGLLYDSGFHERAKPPASLADGLRKETPMQ